MSAAAEPPFCWKSPTKMPDAIDVMRNRPMTDAPARKARAKLNETPWPIRTETSTAPISDTSVLATNPATAV